MPHKREQQTIALCLQSLQALDGYKAEFRAGKLAGDGSIWLQGPWGKTQYAVEVKFGLTPSTVEMVANQIKSFRPQHGRKLLLTDYIHPGMAENLKRKKVEFVDTAGNVYLNTPPVYVEIIGRKKPAKLPRARRAFQTAGLKLIYLLLKQPHAVNWNYRMLAQEAGVSLGIVGLILTDLREMGHVRLTGPSHQAVVKGRDLFNRWELGYAEVLRPKLALKTCRLAEPTKLEDLVKLIRKHHLQQEILIGGELGAALLTHWLRPERATLHIKGDTVQVMKLLRMYPHPDGNVDLLQIFGKQSAWNEHKIEGVLLADPMLVHAELLRKDDERLQETALLIFNKYLEPRIADDQSQ